MIWICIVSYFFSKTLISFVSKKGGAVITLVEDLQMPQFYFALLKANHGI